VSESLASEARATPGELRTEWSERAPESWDGWVEQAAGGSFAARQGFLDALPLALPGAKVSYFTAWRGPRLAGAVPMADVRRWGQRWAYSLPFGTYGGPLCDADDPDRSTVRASLAQAVLAWLIVQRVAGGEIARAPSSEAGPDPAWAQLAETVVQGQAQIIDLEGRTFDDYASGLEKRTRADLRRAQRGGVEIREDPAALAAVHALYLEQARSWKGHRPYPLAFLRALVDHPSRLARLFVGRQEGEVTCGILVLSAGREAFIWWSGASPAARKSAAFPYLIVEIVRACSAAGATRVSLGSSSGMAPVEHFKKSLGATARPLWTYRLAPRAQGPAARLLLWARALKRGR